MRDGWRRVALGEALTLADDRLPVTPGEQYDLAGVYSFGRGLFRREPLLAEKTSYKHLNVLRSDRFVMSKLKAWEGAVTVIGTEFDGAVLSPEFPTYEIDELVLVPAYLRLLTTHGPFWEMLATKSTGMGGRKERVHQGRVLEVELELPSIAEQCRIVDVAGEVDEVIARTARSESSSSALYFALLRDAFEQLALNESVRPLGEVTRSRLGKMLSQAAQTGLTSGLPYVRNADVQWDEIRLSDLNVMEFSEREQMEFALRAGDVLICEGGEVGRAAVVESDLDGIYFQKAIHRVRCGEQRFPRYLMHHLRYCASTGGFADLATAMTIQHLTGEKLRRLELPLPTIPVQRQLVDDLDAVGAVGVRAQSTREATERVRRALLDDLLSGAHEIPASYDALLDAAS